MKIHLKSKKAIVGILSVGLVLTVIALLNLGTYVYRWLFLEHQSIRILYAEDVGFQSQFEAMSNAFEQEYPNIQIEWQAVPKQRFIADQDVPLAESLSGADLILGSSLQGQRLFDARLLDCAPFQKKFADFDQALESKVNFADGKCGLSLYFADFLVAYYNKDIVPAIPQEANILLSKLKQFRDPSSRRFGLGLGEDTYTFLSFMGGLDYFTDAHSTNPAVQHELLTEAFDRVQDLKFFQDLAPRHCYESCLVEMFAEGRVPMFIGGEWLQKGLQSQMGERVGVTHLQELQASGLDLKSPFDGRFLFSIRTPEDNKGPWIGKFIEFLASPAAQERIATDWDKVPAAYSKLPADKTNTFTGNTNWQAGLFSVKQNELTQLIQRLDPILEDFHKGAVAPMLASVRFDQAIVAKEAN